MSETLADRLARATMRIGKLVKDGINPEQQYAYLTSDLIMAEAGQTLAAEGVVVIPGLGEKVETATVTYERFGKPRIRWDVTASGVMIVMCPGEQITVPWSGMGSDYNSADKAHAKAQTQGVKYFLMKLLKVAAANEDGEHENGGTEEGGETGSTTKSGVDHAEGLKAAAANGMPALASYYNKFSKEDPDFQAKWNKLFNDLRADIQKKAAKK